MVYIPPAYNNIIIGNISTAYVPPAYNNIIIGDYLSEGRYAVVFYENNMITISDTLLGTSLPPIVFDLVDKTVHPRVLNEGIPVILENGRLVTLAADEELLI